jgi:glycosyltransferase involved in cell wall biosynthesis
LRVNITIAIATYNRANELRLTLASLVNLQGCRDDYEILVIGNHCTDHTADVVSQFIASSDANVRYLEEPKQGLSHARNRAVAESSAEIVAFLDDDVDVDAGWLNAVSRSYASNNLAAVGGRAFLVYPAARPGWLSDRLEGRLTKVELGPHARYANGDELYGLNLTVKRKWIERVGGFRADLGRNGNCLLGNEETDLLERIQAAGGKLLYEPAAVVGHRVPMERLRRRWFLSRSYWGGRSRAKCMQPEDISARELLRAGWRLSVSAGRMIKAGLCFRISSCQTFDEACVVATRWGDFIGMCHR